MRHAGCCEERADSPRIPKTGLKGGKRTLPEDSRKMPEETATEWERAADEVDRAEWRLLESLEAGDEAAIAACRGRAGALSAANRPPPAESAPRGVGRPASGWRTVGPRSPRLPGFSASLFARIR